MNRDPVASWVDREVESAVSAAESSPKGFGEVSWMDAFVAQMLDLATGATASLPSLIPPQRRGHLKLTTTYVHGNTFQVNPGWQHFRTTEIGDICFVCDYIGGRFVERRATLLQMKVAPVPERPDLSGSSSRKELLLYSLWPSFFWSAGTLRRCLGLPRAASSNDELHPRWHERKGDWVKRDPETDPHDIAVFGIVGDSTRPRCAVHRVSSFRGALSHEGSLGTVLAATLRFHRGAPLVSPVPQADRGWNRIVSDILRGGECQRTKRVTRSAKVSLAEHSPAPLLVAPSDAGRAPTTLKAPRDYYGRGMLIIRAAFTDVHPGEIEV
jgi:hypothetical protein